MRFVVFSDDLTGASGVASLIGKGSVTIPFHNINKINLKDYGFVSIDMETRVSEPGYSGKLFDKLIKMFTDVTFTFRMDSTLKGNIKEYLTILSKYKKIIITDTIPEYNRFTKDGFTIMENNKLNIKKLIPENSVNEIKIMDSRNYNDLKKITLKCISENYIPVDSGILIKLYFEDLKFNK